VQLVGNGKRGEHRCFLGVDGAGGVRDDAHFFIDISGKLLDVGRIEIARDGISLPEDLNFGGWHVRSAARPNEKVAQNSVQRAVPWAGEQWPVARKQ